MFRIRVYRISVLIKVSFNVYHRPQCLPPLIFMTLFDYITADIDRERRTTNARDTPRVACPQFKLYFQVISENSDIENCSTG